MRPSRIKPMRSLVREGWRLAVEMIDSSRVNTSRTGRRVFIASNASMPW